MQCRWAGCKEPRGKGDRKYCVAHRKASTDQALKLMALMYRVSNPLHLLVVVTKGKKKALPLSDDAPAAPNTTDEMRNRLEREQKEINAALDKKCGYGNGPVDTLSSEEIKELAASITPIEQIRGDGRKGRRGKTWNWQRQNERQKLRKGENEA